MLEARQSHTGEADSFIPRAIVHRLDRGTTGLMLIAKSEVAEQQLTEHFKQRTTVKRYVALLSGWPNASAPGAAAIDDEDGSASSGGGLGGGGGMRIHIDVPIDRDPNRPGKMRAVVPNGGQGLSLSRGGGGKAARSILYIHAHSAELNVTLCSVDLLTGRQHQIRVHCAHLGAPLINDDAYGSATGVGAGRSGSASLCEQLGPFARGRPLLHAWSMEVERPQATTPTPRPTLTLRAPLPPDMHAVIAKLWPDLAQTVGPSEWPLLSATPQ